MLSLVLLVLVFLGLRLANLAVLPVFADEAIYIHWAQVIWHDATNRFIPLSDGKPPLHMWLMVLFLKVIENPLMAGRLLSVSAGLATLIGSYLLAKKLFSQKVAIIVGILVVLQPFLLFYDRLALVDSLLTAFGVWSFYLGLLLFKKPTLGKGMLLGTLWGGAMLTKPGGAFFPLMTPPFIGMTPAPPLSASRGSLPLSTWCLLPACMPFVFRRLTSPNTSWRCLKHRPHPPLRAEAVGGVCSQKNLKALRISLASSCPT